MNSHVLGLIPRLSHYVHANIATSEKHPKSEPSEALRQSVLEAQAVRQSLHGWQ